MSSSENAIEINGISKKFDMYDKPSDRLKQFILPSFSRFNSRIKQQYYKEFWALSDVSFNVKKGETVGILGKNGAGKSTLLQLLCGTLTPTSGEIITRGRIAALLELGSGFNPEFSGIENVYLNCALLGLSKEETDNKIDDILSFADIGDFVNQPVKTYSSGMFVRLAFAVNIQSQPEIMIVDEALSVGDMNFQAKCMTALRGIQDNGASILFVSHDTGSVKSLCERGVLLEGGRLIEKGKASDVAENYIKRMRLEMNSHSSSDDSIVAVDVVRSDSEEQIKYIESQQFIERVKPFTYGDGGLQVDAVRVLNSKGDDSSVFTFNESVTVEIYFQSYIECEVGVSYYIHDEKKNIIIGSGPKQAGSNFIKIEQGGKYKVCYETKFPLMAGNYSLQVQINKPLIVGKTAKFLQVVDDAKVFKVDLNNHSVIWSKVYVDNTMQVKQC